MKKLVGINWRYEIKVGLETLMYEAVFPGGSGPYGPFDSIEEQI